MGYKLQSARFYMFKYNNDTTISISNLLKFIDRHKTERLLKIQENENFIIQENIAIDEDFLIQEEKGTFYGVRVRNNLSEVIVNTHLNYVMGNDITYTASVDEEEALSILNQVQRENGLKDQQRDIAEDMGSFGVGYQLVSDINRQIIVERIDAKEAFIIYSEDATPEPIFGVRYYKDFNNILTVEVYSKYELLRYKAEKAGGKEITLIEQKINLYGIVPMIEYSNNRYHHSDFQKVKTYLIDLDKTETTESNTIHYINDAIIVFTNVKATAEKIKNMIDNRAVFLPTTDGLPADIKYLEKTMNINDMQTRLKDLRKSIYSQSFTPELTSEEMSKNVSGKALEGMYVNTETIATKKQSQIRKGIMIRNDIIFAIINENLVGKPYDYYSIMPQFKKNLPTLESSELEDIIKLSNAGILSRKTILEAVPTKFLDDLEKELERLAEEETEYVFPVLEE